MSRIEQIFEELEAVERRIRRLNWDLDEIILFVNSFLRRRQAGNINRPEARMAATQARAREIRVEIARAREEQNALIVEFIGLIV